MEKINNLKKIFKEEKIDGYIIPKNDEFFGEYIPDNKDRLKYISNFSGSYGFAFLVPKLATNQCNTRFPGSLFHIHTASYTHHLLHAT